MQVKLTALFSLLLLGFVTAEEAAAVAADVVEDTPAPPYEPLAELKIDVIKAVDCPLEERSKNGDKLAVHYIGWLAASGKQFDTSHNRGLPFTFPIGKGNTIQGWEKGLLGMCLGEKRKLNIPWSMAYGEHGRPPVIPPKSDLIFETTLMRINDKTYKPKKEAKKEEKKEEEKKEEEKKEEEKEEEEKKVGEDKPAHGEL